MYSWCASIAVHNISRADRNYPITRNSKVTFCDYSEKQTALDFQLCASNYFQVLLTGKIFVCGLIRPLFISIPFECRVVLFYWFLYFRFLRGVPL